jgi:predicted ATPase
LLIQFRVENHRSLRDEQVLSLVAANHGESDDPRLIRAPGLGEQLLPVVAIYGANASGKTNVLLALGFMREAIVRSHRFWDPDGGTPQEPFALSDQASAPSTFEADVVTQGVRYQYGFELSAQRVEREWLRAWPNGRKQVWFEREGDKFSFGKLMHGENEAIRGLTRSNSLFLSCAAQNNHVQLTPLFNWFHAHRGDLDRAGTRQRAQHLRAIFSEQLTLFPELNESRSDARRLIVDLLRAADLGIVDIRVGQADGPIPTGRRQSAERVEIFLKHRAAKGVDGWLALEEESAGTATLLTLAPRLLRALEHGSLFSVDELEASLHPSLGLELLKLFQDPKRNRLGAQLIFTTHDSNLLGNMLGERPLRRDQIWFTEKDHEGATHLYPLTDFRPRAEENIERGYLQGRYGAVPFLSGLLADEDATKDQ